ncbi:MULTISPECIES: hypothetical protein [unclassified Coleofasciculus]|uniref:hypothetical protein n=1 Tax=unclassified Coleofasciculus TaxID=2692782 RepID=UPI00187E22B0|nr:MULTISPECIES: hypothetical protein [unclassified Coleofasciculus]MBE9127419.1 hypothetical protein [Coleofasciculus sp. LEGE 07081]MBE9149254.1 hypothetical protein [Coleofasciculus sp. LEGE 07092]
MNKSTPLIYPTLDLFLYDLRDGLGEYPGEIQRNRQGFWQKIDRDLDEKQLAELEALESSEADYVQLANKSFEPPIDGYYCALQLGDIYALQLNCSGEYKDVSTQQRNEETKTLDNLRTLKQLIVSKINQTLERSEIALEGQGTIGQTWVVSVQIADTNQDPRQLAKECYQHLTPNSNWKPTFKEQGRLLGARIFEYWHSPENWNQDWELFSSENYHILICLFPAGKKVAEIREKVDDVYLDLTRLFSYRHKVVWAYWQSRRLTTNLKNQFLEIRELTVKVRELTNLIQSPRLNLETWQIILTKSLSILSEYAVNLNDLEFHSHTIRVNIENYKKWWYKIEREANGYLKPLGNFSELADEKYLQQVEIDCANLRPGLRLLENLIRTIGGITEIEQTRSDRVLNRTVAVATSGLVISLMAAAVLIEQFPPATDVPFFLTSAFLGGIVAGLIPVAIAFVILKSSYR